MTRQLLFSLTKKDFKVEFFRCPGHGGQNVNKVETGVRIIHPESGAVAESCEERKQHQNKKIAFNKLVKTKEFQVWHKRKVAEMLLSDVERKEIERKVDNWMREENLKVEYF